jgi:hypothetical protein
MAHMITSPRKILLATAVVVLSGGGVASAAVEPAASTAYSCDALTSANVPSVKKRLTSQGIDVSDVTGPVGLSCRKTEEDGTGEGTDNGESGGVTASVTGVDGVAYRCASAEEKSGPRIVFFVDCAQSTSVTG